MVQNFMVQGRLFRGSQENSPEGTPLPSRGGFIHPVLALNVTVPDSVAARSNANWALCLGGG